MGRRTISWEIVGKPLLRMDSRHRIVLGKRLRRVSGIVKGDKLVAVPFKGGIIIVSTKQSSFVGSLNGFHFVEEKHEADAFLKRMNVDANLRHGSPLRGR